MLEFAYMCFKLDLNFKAWLNTCRIHVDYSLFV